MGRLPHRADQQASRGDAPRAARRPAASSRPALAAGALQSELPGRLPLEHSARSVVIALLFLLCLPRAFAAHPYFTISTYKTFAPDEKPKLHLYSRDEPELEFRVYHINDPEKFIGNLSELHSFGETVNSPVEQIDEKTLLERFHDWKHSLWISLRDFFRTQLSSETRDALKEKQSALAQRSRIVGVAQFAQVPLLNDKQLVARWRQQVPPTYVSDNQVLPIDALPSGMYLVEATDGHLKAYTLLMVSETALVTRTVAGQMVAFVVDRKTGAPVSGAKVLLALGKQPPLRLCTKQDGVASFDAPASAKKSDDEATGVTETSESKLWVMARSGDDVALVAPWYSSFTETQDVLYSAFGYTDRPVYRPGNTVHFKAIIRQHEGDALVLPKLQQIHVVISDDQQKSVYDKQLPVSATGTVQGDLDLPLTASLSGYSISSDTHPDLSNLGSFQVEDYRKPEYQVRVTAARPRVLQGESDTATIDSRYFFGEPVANAKVKYTVSESAHYWWDGGDDSDASAQNPDGSPSDDAQESTGDAGEQNSVQEGRLDADGKLTVSVPTSFDPNRHFDKDYVIEAGVTDQAGREISGRYRVLATYGSFRLEVEPLSYSVQQGQKASFQVTAVDYDGKPVKTPVHVHLYHRTYGQGWPRTWSDTPAGDADATTGADGTAVVQMPVNTAGSLSVDATAVTPEKRTVKDTGWLWVNGSQEADFGDEENQQLRIIADKKAYAPGDTAHLTLITQVEGFHALITASGVSAEFQKVIDSPGKVLNFDLPITKQSQPNLTVDVVFLKDDKVYQGQRTVSVPPTQQKLQITITPAADTFQPQQAATYDVLARDASGAPVSADLSFGVVDEAVYSVEPDTSGNILKAFYPDREINPDIENSLTYYFTGEAGTRYPMLAQRRYRPLLAQVKPSVDTAPRVRKDFPDTAFWQPSIHTDATGHARITLTFPDSLTTWRATVRAVTADTKAGAAVNRVIVRKNIIVRLGQPRFLRKGDIVTMPVIVHNYLPETKQIQLSLDAAGVEVISGAPQSVTVAPRADATILYRLRASSVGTATLTAKALTSPESDAMQITLPVHPSGVAEAMAASGVIANSGDHTTPVSFPAGTDPAAHSLTVQVSPTIAGSVFSALNYLTTFPYGCTEQTMSSFLPNIIVAQAMQKLNLSSKMDQATLNAKIQAGLDRLSDYQHDDGGWGWWKEDQSQVFMTAYVVSGLAQAKKAGYSKAGIPANWNAPTGIDFLQRALKEHPRMLPELRAYVVYALAESDHVDRGQLDTLYSRRSDLSALALAYTGLAMLDANDAHAADIAKLLEKKARVEGDLASWPASRNDLLDIDYDGSAESTAFALKFLAHADPQSPLLVKAAQWLVANRSEGYWWGSTQQTAFVLYGLTDYLLVSHELAGDTNVEVFVNGASAGSRHFTQADALQGATMNLTLDAPHLQQQNSVRVVATGSGRTYWSTQAGYFSTSPHSYQQGSLALNIARDYSLLVPTTKDGHIVYTLQPLHGPVSQGDVLAVHIGVTGSPQKYLLIEDPIPAGTEFLQNTDTYNIVNQPSGWDWWYTRQEFHDDHAAIFADTFDGRHDSFYLLKVVNPGSFAISPASVAPMYQPGVQATTDELHLDVKEVTK
jgi:uncharacterized protein YfaS (alpha-2-macroglobulin family)